MATISSRVIEVCVFRVRDAVPEYLILKRSANEAVYPGVWQIVTGMIEGDERALTAALRELREETGLRPEKMWVTPYVDTFYSIGSDTVNLTPVFAVQVKMSDEPQLSNEHQEFLWLTYEAALKRLVWRGQQNAIIHTHTYIVGGMEGGSLAEIQNFTHYER